MKKKEFSYAFPRPAVTTDCIIYGYNVFSEQMILLIERKFDPFKGFWAFPGGFLNMDESAEEGVKREVFEETGIYIEKLDQLFTASLVDRDPRGRVISIVFITKVDMSITSISAGDDASNVRWFNLKELPKLAFDHDQILSIALERINKNR